MRDLETSHSQSAPTTAELLQRWAAGHAGAFDELIQVVVDELRRIAASCMKSERAAHTLQPTALVNELYVRLSRGTPARLQDRAAFLQFATQTLRRILVDHARAKAAEKRGGKETLARLDDVVALLEPQVDLDVLALHEALLRLEDISPRRARIVELRFFGGQELNSIAEALDVSPSTVSREWRSARTWLYRELGPASEG